MYEKFTDWTPTQKNTKARLHNVRVVLDDYSDQGIRVSLRQLYYRLVALGVIPNDKRSYKRLGEVVVNARLGGLVDWDMIVDHGRVAKMPPEWRDPLDLMDDAINSYRLPRWADQDYHIEVWCEKDALTTILEPITNRYHVALLSHTGFSSVTALYRVAKQFQKVAESGRQLVVLYLGDHDPSGLDMLRDLENRVDILSRSCEIELIHLGITKEQVNLYQPPPDFVKVSDTRAPKYVAEHGNESWEVDALQPQVLNDLLSSTIEQYLDADKWKAVLKQEEKDKEALAEARERLEWYRQLGNDSE